MSKRLAVVTLVLGVVMALSIGEAFSAEFSFSGEARLRPEYRDNADFSSTASDTQNYYGQRLRLGVDVKINETLKGFIQIQDTRYWGHEDTAAAPASLYTGDEDEALDLHQAYVEIANVGDMPLTLKVGRQLLTYGEHRLVGDLGWSNNARAFDAIKAIYKTDTYSVDLWTAKVDENSIAAATAPSPSAIGPSDNDIDFYGIYSMIKSVPNVPIDAYLLYRRDGDTGENRYTFGGRAEAKPIEGLDLMGELAYQTGDSTATVDISAYAFALRAGYAIPGAWSPKVSIEYDYATGDSDAADTENETFNQLYPTWHRNLGYGDYVAWQNISAIKLGVTAKPTEKCHASLDYWLFSLAEEKDTFYTAAGTTTGRPSQTDAFVVANTEDSVGNELDIIFRHTFNPNLNVEIGLARFFKGDWIESWRGAAAEDSDWAYLMATVSF